MAEEFSWDPDVATNQAYPAMLDVADQAYTYSQPDTEVLDGYQYGLGPIGNPAFVQAQQFYSDKQTWGVNASSKLTNHASNTLSANGVVLDQDGGSAANIHGAAEI
jgi:hypothetical protein